MKENRKAYLNSFKITTTGNLLSGSVNFFNFQEMQSKTSFFLFYYQLKTKEQNPQIKNKAESKWNDS